MESIFPVLPGESVADDDDDGDDKTSTDTCGVTGPTLSALCIVSNTILILPTFLPPLTEEDMNG